MSKGIVGIQSTFGIGGVGDRCMIDIEMYKRDTSAQTEWMQYPSTGGNTYPTASIIEGDYIYLGGTTSATSVFGETTGIGGAVDAMYWVGKFKKSDFSKVWVKFFDNSLVDGLPGENLANAGDNLAFVLMTSVNTPTAYLIDKANGNTVTTANLSVSGSTDTRAYNMVASSNYLWTVGYTYISGVYDTRVWRLNHDLSNVVKTATSFYGTDYSNECRISSNGNYLIVNEQNQVRLKVIDISTGTPSALSTEFYPNPTGVKELAYCTRTNSNRWMLFCQTQNSPYTLSLRRRSLNDLATVIYDQDYGSQANTGRAGDVRYFNSKFYICYKDVANSRFRIERIADSDTYTLEASINIIPNTYTDALLKQHSFNTFDDVNGIVITGLKGKIEADAIASETYYDVVFKLFTLP